VGRGVLLRCQKYLSFHNPALRGWRPPNEDAFHHLDMAQAFMWNPDWTEQHR